MDCTRRPNSARVQHSIIMEFEEGQPTAVSGGGGPPLPCHLAACSPCNNKSEAGLAVWVQGSRDTCTTGGWLVAARQGDGTGKDPPHKGSYWLQWYLTRPARAGMPLTAGRP